MKRSLEELRARARSMEAGLEERDALLRELARTPEADEDIGPRAEQLRLIIEDPWLGGFQGSNGRRVDKAALRALRALGEPYASELFPGLQEELDRPDPRKAPAATQASEPRPGALGQALAVVTGGIELLLVFGLLTSRSDRPFALILSGIIACSLFLPALLPRAPPFSLLDLLRRFGLLCLTLVTAGWSLLTFAGLVFNPHWDAEALGVMLIAIAIVTMHVMMLTSLARVPPAQEPPPRPGLEPRNE